MTRNGLTGSSAQTLAFVARRLMAEPVALVFASREAGGEELTGLPELTIRGLRNDDARALLDSVILGRLDERVRERIVAETRGNPLALLELPQGITPAELAGGFALPDAGPLAGQIEQSFMRRIDSLPIRRNDYCLTAAAEPMGDRAVVDTRRAAARDRCGRGRAGHGGGIGRARRPCAIPPSFGALGGLPRGGFGRPTGGTPGAGRGHRSPIRC